MRIDLDYNINNMEIRGDNKCKAYTSLEQSKMLTEILPLESADMYYFLDPTPAGNIYHLTVQRVDVGIKNLPQYDKGDIPCWSLAALLNVLPKICYPVKEHPTYLILGKPKDKWCILYWDATGMQDGEQTLGDNPIDACYEMIIKLHELNVL